MDNFSEPFIRRPVLTTLLAAATLGAGVLGYRLLPVNDLPSVDFPTVLVNASLPGANPETMAASVATPLEKEFSSIAGLDSMSSVSALGQTQIALQFALDRSIDSAALDVQAAISRAGGRLPRDLPAPPSFNKTNPAEQPIIYMALTSDVLPLHFVDEYAQTFVAQRLSTLPGVAQVTVLGSQKFAVRVRVDPTELAARGLALDAVADAVRQANVRTPLGALHGPTQSFVLQASGQLPKAADYRPIVVAWRKDTPIRLGDIATVEDAAENERTVSWFNRQRSVVLAVERQPGANTVEVAARVRRLLPQLEAELPPTVKFNLISDRALPIQESIADVKFTLLLTVALVALVIFLFLRNLRATLIPCVAVPLSLVGTFAAMHLLGYSLNNLSLLALTLAVGFVVDDAIVMLENVVRRMEQGEDARTAALRGSREVAFTILSMTVSLAAVFIPVVFLGGLLGRLLNEFAVTIAVAIAISGAVSVTVTPMMCARFLRAPRPDERPGRLFRAFEAGFDAFKAAYARTLDRALRHETLVTVGSLALVAGTAWLFARVPKGFLPTEDSGFLVVSAEGAQDASFERMRDLQRAATELVIDHPGVAAASSSTGISARNATGNVGRMFVRLKDRRERAPAAQVVAELRQSVGAVPGLARFIQQLAPIRLGGRISKSQYQLTLESADTAALYASAGRLEARLRTLPELADVSSDLLARSAQLDVAIDRALAASMGISAARIETALADAYGSRQISSIYAPTNTYQVILEAAPRFQRTPGDLSRVYLRTERGGLTPLESVANLTRGVGTLSVNHSGQLPSVTLSFDARPGVSLGDALAAVDHVAPALLADGVNSRYQGAAQAFQDSQRGLGLLLLAAIAVIYIVLGMLYESYLHPLTILSGLPSAGFGALLTLLLLGLELDVYAFVGLVMLVGIVKKNAIMMIDFALEAQRTRGLPPAAAIREACLVRFRPIMMTTMAALTGILPIALGYGAGAESRRPLGWCVLGGLAVSQALTLYITPVVYLQFERLAARFRRAA